MSNTQNIRFQLNHFALPVQYKAAAKEWLGHCAHEALHMPETERLEWKHFDVSLLSPERLKAVGKTQHKFAAMMAESARTLRGSKVERKDTYTAIPFYHEAWGGFEVIQDNELGVVGYGFEEDLGNELYLNLLYDGPADGLELMFLTLASRTFKLVGDEAILEFIGHMAMHYLRDIEAISQEWNGHIGTSGLNSFFSITGTHPNATEHRKWSLTDILEYGRSFKPVAVA